MNELFRPISALRGVGEKRAKAYARLGIQTPYDLLFHIPRSYLDFRNPVFWALLIADGLLILGALWYTGHKLGQSSKRT